MLENSWKWSRKMSNPSISIHYMINGEYSYIVRGARSHLEEGEIITFLWEACPGSIEDVLRTSSKKNDDPILYFLTAKGIIGLRKSWWLADLKWCATCL